MTGLAGGGQAPHAPWAARGEVVLVWLRGSRGRRGRMPQGIAPLPGPAVLIGVRYTTTPVGPYLELSVGEPSRLGLRPGLCITAMAVSDPAAKVGSRLNWGLPAELARLEWLSDGEERGIAWPDRQLVARARPVGPTIPVLVPVRSTQRRGDGPVVVPRRLAGLMRFARVEVEVPDGDPLRAYAGSHVGVVIRAARLVMQPARQPAGLLSSLRAPARAPEPALSGRDARRAAGTAT